MTDSARALMEAALIVLRRVGVPLDKFTRLRARPSVGLNEILEGTRRLIRMPRHHGFDVARDVEELRLAREERRDHNFVGRIKRAWHRARSLERLERQPQTWKSIVV